VPVPVELGEVDPADRQQGTHARDVAGPGHRDERAAAKRRVVFVGVDVRRREKLLHTSGAAFVRRLQEGHALVVPAVPVDVGLAAPHQRADHRGIAAGRRGREERVLAGIVRITNARVRAVSLGVFRPHPVGLEQQRGHARLAGVARGRERAPSRGRNVRLGGRPDQQRDHGGEVAAVKEALVQGGKDLLAKHHAEHLRRVRSPRARACGVRGGVGVIGEVGGCVGGGGGGHGLWRGVLGSDGKGTCRAAKLMRGTSFDVTTEIQSKALCRRVG